MPVIGSWAGAFTYALSNVTPNNFIKFQNLGNFMKGFSRGNLATGILLNSLDAIQTYKQTGDSEQAWNTLASGLLTTLTFTGAGLLLAPAIAALGVPLGLATAIVGVSCLVDGLVIGDDIFDFFSDIFDEFDLSSRFGDWLYDFIHNEVDDSYLRNFFNAKNAISPIAIDLDGDGVESSGPDSSLVMFDFDGDGNKNITGWINADDGFFVYDRNGDDIINNGGELFGEHTLKYDGSGELCADD